VTATSSAHQIVGFWTMQSATLANVNPQSWQVLSVRTAFWTIGAFVDTNTMPVTLEQHGEPHRDSEPT